MFHHSQELSIAQPVQLVHINSQLDKLDVMLVVQGHTVISMDKQNVHRVCPANSQAQLVLQSVTNVHKVQHSHPTASHHVLLVMLVRLWLSLVNPYVCPALLVRSLPEMVL